MDISIRKNNGVVILDLIGDIDINASNLIEKVAWCLQNGVFDILCNFENVNLIDYAGLSALAIAYKNVLNHQGRVKFINVPLHIKNIFSLACLDKFFEIYDSEELALNSFKEDKVILEIQKKQLRRRFKRLSVNVKAEFKSKFSYHDIYQEGKVFNLSAIGVLIFCKRVCPLNDILKLKLFLLPKPGVIEVDAKVVWLVHKELQPQLYPGMGVEFYNIEPHLQEAIVDFVNRNMPLVNSIED